MARFKMISIGPRLANDAIETYSFGDAPSFSDYDAALVDVAHVSEFVEAVIAREERRDNSGNLILNHDDDHRAGFVSLRQVVQRREQEARMLIQSGGLLILLIHPPSIHSLRGGGGDWLTYGWVPTPIQNMFHPNYLMRSEGSNIELIAKNHPFARYFHAFAGQLRHRASFANGVFASKNEETVLARRPTREVVAAMLSFPNNAGKLVLLPVPPMFSEEERKKLAGVLLDCVSRALAAAASESGPEWTNNYDLPDLAALQDELHRAETQASEAQSIVEKARKRVENVERFKGLLWMTGKHQLEPVVRDALSELGFQVVEEGERDAVLYTDGKKVAIAEIEGSDSQIEIGKYRQLLDYVQDEFGLSGNLLKGILIGNGLRRQPPEERGNQFTDACIRGAMSQSYCLFPSVELFNLICQVLEAPPGDQRESLRQFIREDIMTCTGIYKGFRQKPADK